jgi:uncharacterized protein
VTPRARLPLPDASRALAIAGVLLVNGIGYASAPWGPLLGDADPAGSPGAIALQALVGAVFQGKAYPVLAFLFGLSLALSTSSRQPQSLAAARRRLRLLLLVGVLHGTLLYFGDILTLYALCGLLALRHVHQPWSRLRRVLRVAAAVALATMTLALALALAAIGATQDREMAPALAAVDGYRGFLWLNASTYAMTTALGLLLTLPLLLLCTLAGIAAARLRLLTGRRWRAARQAWLRRGFWPLATLNGLYGLALAFGAGQPWGLALESAAPFVGVPMSALLLAALAESWDRGHRRWLVAIAPLGRRTLTVYVGYSLACAVLYSGAGLGWQPGTVATATVAMACWVGALLLARASRRRWPLEAWTGRAT